MKKSTAPDPLTPPVLEQNILGQRMDGSITDPPTTQCSDVTKKRRAPRVGLKGGRRRTNSVAERMTARTIKDSITGCWNFQGCLVGNYGYGQIDLGGGMRAYAHRVAWALVHGPIPDDKLVLHSCDNGRCVNVEHLRLGTQAENVHESLQKGRYNAYGHQKLDARKVLAIRTAAANGEAQGTIAARFGIARNTVSQVVNHKTWAHVRADGIIFENVERPTNPFERVPHVLLPVAGEVR
jgi:hypothetical protein